MSQPALVETLRNGFTFEMIYVEGGSFRMGGGDEEAYEDEKPIHPVSVPSFYMSKYLVTQALWEAVMGNNPSGFKVSDRPVEKVSWEDVKQFLEKLNGLTGRVYRLPSESEWEYAARGGVRTMGFLYAGSDKLREVGWYDKNSGGETHPVGQLLGNELGIYDLSGNVLEWCEDDWHEKYQGAPDDGSAWIDQPKRGPSRVLRGGDWGINARLCRVSYRSYGGPDVRTYIIGFRLCLSLSSSSGK